MFPLLKMLHTAETFGGFISIPGLLSMHQHIVFCQVLSMITKRKHGWKMLQMPSYSHSKPGKVLSC